MKIDLHNHSLEEAKEEIFYSLEECRTQMDNTLEIIHGHKHGTVIRDYIRSKHFLNDNIKSGHVITSKNFSEEDKTIFQIKLTIIHEFKEKGNVTPSKVNAYICHKCNKLMIPLEGLNWIKCPICGKFQKR